MTLFDAALFLLVILGVAARYIAPPAVPKREEDRGRDWLTPGVFLACFVAQVVWHLVEDSSWRPHGPDWDTWLLSAMAWTGKAPHFPQRWPMYGLFAALLDWVTPGPMYIKVQLISHLAVAASAAGVYRLGRALLGSPGALAAAILVGSFPVVMKMGAWSNAHALWAAAAVWAVVGLGEATRSNRPLWWAVAGFAIAVVMACMAKGLLLGTLLVGLYSVAALFNLQRGARRALWGLLPFAALALLYLSISTSFMPFEWYMESAQESYDREGAAARAGGPLPGTLNVKTVEGYVFGQSMSPATIWRAFHRANKIMPATERAANTKGSIGKVRRLFPSAGVPILVLLCLAPLVGLWQQRRRPGGLVAWAGIGVIIVGTLPALLSRLEYRFLLPLLTILPLLLLAPVSAGVRGRRRPWAWLPLLTLPAALLPGSPWLEKAEVDQAFRAIEVRAEFSWVVRRAMARDYPEAQLSVLAPPPFALILDGRKGRMFTLDPRFFHWGADLRFAAEHHVLLEDEPRITRPTATQPGAVAVISRALIQRLYRQRPVLKRWAPSPMAPPLVLFGPRSSP